MLALAMVPGVAQITPLSHSSKGTTKQTNSVPVQDPSAADKTKEVAQQNTGSQNPHLIPNPDKAINGEDLRIQRKVADFTLLLVIVGLLQALALLGTLWIAMRQADLMRVHAGHLDKLADAAENNANAASLSAATIERQAGIMDSQLKTMQGQLDTTMNQLAEMEKQTRALERSVQFVVNKERPHLSFEVGELVLTTSPFKHALESTLTNYGPTDAFIISAKDRLFVADSEIPDPDIADHLHEMSIPKIIRGGSEPLGVKVSPIIFQFDDAQITKIKNRTQFAHYLAVIKYKDVFFTDDNDIRVTSISKVWRITDLKNLPLSGLKRDEFFAYWADSSSPIST